MADSDRVEYTVLACSRLALVRLQGTFQRFSALVLPRSSLAMPRCITYRHKCACVIPVIRSRCSAPSTWIPSPDVDRVVRSHVDENKVIETHPHRTAFPRNSSDRNPPQNGSHIHSHTFRSRILHTGTLYLLSPPTLASIYSPPPHLHFRLLPTARVSPARKSASLSAARVSWNFFNTSPNTTHSEPQLHATTTVLASELPTLYWKILSRCLTAIANKFFFVFDRDGGHQVCALRYRYVYQALNGMEHRGSCKMLRFPKFRFPLRESPKIDALCAKIILLFLLFILFQSLRLFCHVEGTICPISFVKETLVRILKPVHSPCHSPSSCASILRPTRKVLRRPKRLSINLSHHTVPLRPLRPPHRPRHAMGLP